MPKPSGKMNDRERAICARIVEIRKANRLPQREFASLFGISRNQAAGIEYGLAPVKYSLARDFSYIFHINPVWLAMGHEPQRGNIFLPSLTALKEADNSLFSGVFDRHLWPLFEKAALASTFKMRVRYQRAEVWAAAVKLWFAHFVPDDHLEILETELDQFWKDFYARIPHDNELTRSVRDYQLKAYRSQNGERRAIGREKHLKVSLDIPVASGENAGVLKITTLSELISTIKRFTKERGMKAALAKECGVTRQAVDQWISESAKPSAEAVFSALEWVQRRSKHKQ